VAGFVPTNIPRGIRLRFTGDYFTDGRGIFSKGPPDPGFYILDSQDGLQPVSSQSQTPPPKTWTDRFDNGAKYETTTSVIAETVMADGKWLPRRETFPISGTVTLTFTGKYAPDGRGVFEDRSVFIVINPQTVRKQSTSTEWLSWTDVEFKTGLSGKSRPDSKDRTRIDDIYAKVTVNGSVNYSRMYTLSRQMARSIDGIGKALRRGRAAEEHSNPQMQKMRMLFYARALQIAGISGYEDWLR